MDELHMIEGMLVLEFDEEEEEKEEMADDEVEE